MARAATGAPDAEHRAFQVPDGIGHRRLVALACYRAEFIRSEEMEKADRLGRAEEEVDTCHRSTAALVAELTITGGITSSEHIGQVIRTDLSRQAEDGTTPARPHTRGLPRHHRHIGSAGDEVTYVVVDTPAPHHLHPQHCAPAICHLRTQASA